MLLEAWCINLCMAADPSAWLVIRADLVRRDRRRLAGHSLEVGCGSSLAIR